MKLYYAAASPFVRKVQIAAIELKLDDRIELLETHVTPGKENVGYARQVNPLRKIPALETDDGLVILDSTVICDYLNDIDGNNRLIPAEGPKRWQVQTGQAIANGIMEAAVLNRYETFMRPEAQRWTLWIDEQFDKISNSLDWFDSQENGPLMTIDDISLACALGYLDFRFKDFPWRDRCKNLAKWHDSIAKRASYQNTSPE